MSKPTKTLLQPKAIKMVPPEDMPDFPSYEKATWRDVDGKVHQQYVIQPSSQGAAVMIIDTNNNANTVESRQPFQTEADARDC